VPPDCIIVVVYGSLVDVHNLRSQSLVGRLYLAWCIDPTGRYGYRIRILGWSFPTDGCEIEPEAQLRATQFREWIANERRSSQWIWCFMGKF